jgi:hypothetical protein
MTPPLQPRHRVLYAAGQATLLVAAWMVPGDSWARTALGVLIGWTAAACAFASAVWMRQNAAVWRLFGTGLFLNAAGILVEHTLVRLPDGDYQSPNLADLFWLGLYPCMISGLAILVYRERGHEESEGLGVVAGTVASTIVTLAVSIFAWEFIVLPQTAADRFGPMARVVNTLYPAGDLVMLNLLLRLLLGGHPQHMAFWLTLASIFCFLGADVGWAFEIQGATFSGAAHSVLEVASYCGYALMGGAAISAAAQPIAGPVPYAPRAGRMVVVSLLVSLLAAPLLILALAVSAWSG